MIENWGRINSHLKYLKQADENPYFDLVNYCNDKQLNYRDIKGFINTGNKICSGEINIIKDLKQQLKTTERLSKQLDIIIT